MAARRQRDELAEFLRGCAAGLRGRGARLARRLLAPAERWLCRRLPPSRVLFPVGMAIFILGWALAPVWKIAEWGGAQWPTTELPFCDLKDVAVDSQGRIYVLDAFHGRVQRYSPDGQFQRGWIMPMSFSKVSGLRITPDDRVIVRAKKLLTYSSDGELLEINEHKPEDRQGRLASETEPTGPYAVRRGLLPRVVDARTDRTVVTTPWYRRLLAFPFPAFLYGVIGLAVMAVGAWRRYREQAAEPPAAADPPRDPAPGASSLTRASR